MQSLSIPIYTAEWVDDAPNAPEEAETIDREWDLASFADHGGSFLQLGKLTLFPRHTDGSLADICSALASLPAVHYLAVHALGSEPLHDYSPTLRLPLPTVRGFLLTGHFEDPEAPLATDRPDAGFKANQAFFPNAVDVATSVVPWRELAAEPWSYPIWSKAVIAIGVEGFEVSCLHRRCTDPSFTSELFLRKYSKDGALPAIAAGLQQIVISTVLMLPEWIRTFIATLEQGIYPRLRLLQGIFVQEDRSQDDKMVTIERLIATIEATGLVEVPGPANSDVGLRSWIRPSEASEDASVAV